jgi:uncharacterized protein
VRVFYVDASALVKRYSLEVGTPLMNHLFSRVPRNNITLLNVGIAEVVAVFTRKRNAGKLTPAAFAQALIDFGAEVVDSPDVGKLHLDDSVVKGALPLIVAHSLNGTDGIILRSALTFALALRADGNDIVVVTADQRLLKAAQAEGLESFDPETQTQADLDSLIGP